MQSAKRLARAVGLPLSNLVIRLLAPLVDSREFKVLYPVLVVSLGVLAVKQLDAVRGVVVTAALLIIFAVATATVLRDRSNIRLHYNWNLLFFNYYRPYLLELAQRVVRSYRPDRYPGRVDVLTLRPGDFFSELRSASADFELVSGRKEVHIASFDIEYLSSLRNGLETNGVQHKLVPLSEFWEGRGLETLKSRIPEEILESVLHRLDSRQLFALPLGWGLVGVMVVDRDLTTSEANALITSYSPSNKQGFEFSAFLEKVEKLSEMGYELFCYDFWSSLCQLILLNQRGSMSLTDEDERALASTLQRLQDTLAVENIIANPLLLLERVQKADKAIVIGGATWFGIKGTLLPVATPDSEPVYGAFCECLGVLSAPLIDGRRGDNWEEDAYKLVAALADQLGDQRSSPQSFRRDSIIVRNYMPGLLRPTIGTAGTEKADLWSQHAMLVDETAARLFRQFSTEDIESLTRIKELWQESRVKIPLARPA